jgi:hypothetical protein
MRTVGLLAWLFVVLVIVGCQEDPAPVVQDEGKLSSLYVA